MDDPTPRLIADVGGTHARFAWQARRGAALEQIEVLRCAEHASLEMAIRHYLAPLRAAGRAAPRAAAIGIANPIDGDTVRMTNRNWQFSIAGLRARLGLERLIVVNDYAALAMALPGLPESARWQLGGDAALAGAPLALIGAGTGLGVAGLVPAAGGGWRPLEGEGGHVTLAPADAREAAVVGLLRERFGHASAERALSGAGLVALYEALCTLSARVPAPDADPETVLARGLHSDDACCAEALAMFCALLGTAAGNLALTLGARGGVYVGGGLVPRLGRAFFAASAFRSCFEAKGRMAAYLTPIPVYVIDTPVSPALEGASRML